MDPKVSMTPCVNAEHLPPEVEEWCDANEISTHCSNTLVQVDDDGNVFAEWLKTLGIEFSDAGIQKGWMWIGVFGS